jgi:hypothetical protein
MMDSDWFVSFLRRKKGGCYDSIMQIQVAWLSCIVSKVLILVSLLTNSFYILLDRGVLFSTVDSIDKSEFISVIIYWQQQSLSLFCILRVIPFFLKKKEETHTQYITFWEWTLLEAV